MGENAENAHYIITADYTSHFCNYIKARKKYTDAGKIQLIREYGQLESEEYTQEGIKVKGYVPAWVGGKL